jgi:hypothetical protein
LKCTKKNILQGIRHSGRGFPVSTPGETNTLPECYRKRNRTASVVGAGPDLEFYFP